MELIRYQGSDDWSALYIDGKLDRVGDHYLVDERISEIAGVMNVYSDDFLRGGDSRDDVAETTEQINEYGALRAERENRASELRVQAQRLLEEAQRLEYEG